MDVASNERLETFYVVSTDLWLTNITFTTGSGFKFWTDTIPDFTKFDFELKADVDAVLSSRSGQ